IVVTGNTSAWRGKAAFAGFAPTKAAQRVLCESLARALGPKGVHVAYVVIDAVIDVPWTRQAYPDRPDSFFIRPEGIAGAVHHVAHQERWAWTFELDLRPYGENWCPPPRRPRTTGSPPPASCASATAASRSSSAAPTAASSCACAATTRTRSRRAT